MSHRYSGGALARPARARHILPGCRPKLPSKGSRVPGRVKKSVSQQRFGVGCSWPVDCGKAAGAAVPRRAAGGPSGSEDRSRTRRVSRCLRRIGGCPTSARQPRSRDSLDRGGRGCVGHRWAGDPRWPGSRTWPRRGGPPTRPARPKPPCAGPGRSARVAPTPPPSPPVGTRTETPGRRGEPSGPASRTPAVAGDHRSPRMAAEAAPLPGLDPNASGPDTASAPPGDETASPAVAEAALVAASGALASSEGGEHSGAGEAGPAATEAGLLAQPAPASAKALPVARGGASARGTAIGPAATTPIALDGRAAAADASGAEGEPLSGPAERDARRPDTGGQESGARAEGTTEAAGLGQDLTSPPWADPTSHGPVLQPAGWGGLRTALPRPWWRGRHMDPEPREGSRICGHHDHGFKGTDGRDAVQRPRGRIADLHLGQPHRKRVAGRGGQLPDLGFGPRCRRAARDRLERCHREGRVRRHERRGAGAPGRDDSGAACGREIDRRPN